MRGPCTNNQHTFKDWSQHAPQHLGDNMHPEEAAVQEVFRPPSMLNEETNKKKKKNGKNKKKGRGRK
jgi:hypothetical protein